MEIEVKKPEELEQAEPHRTVTKEELLRRLARIEGQVRGVQRLVENDAYCVDVLVQISAVRAALKAVGLSILDRHMRTCVSSAIRAERAEESINELISVIKRFTK
ncbi:MAG: metal-sensitive transcriptional regulator [Chitinophagales bacterium]